MFSEFRNNKLKEIQKNKMSTLKKIYKIYDKNLDREGNKMFIATAHSTLECAQILKVTERTILNYIKQGHIVIESPEKLELEKKKEEIESMKRHIEDVNSHVQEIKDMKDHIKRLEDRIAIMDILKDKIMILEDKMEKMKI